MTNFTINTRSDFDAAQATLTDEFIEQILNAEVVSRFFGHGYITSCYNPCNDFESIIITVCFDNGEIKKYGAAVVLNNNSLKFADTETLDLWNSYLDVHNDLKSQLAKVNAEMRAREKELQKLEQKRKENEKKIASMRASAEREINNLVNNREHLTEAEEFYYSLGWLANHTGTIVAKMPDYLENAFVKHFGDMERTVVDSTKVGPSGYTSQWRLSMEVSLKKADNVPSYLSDYLNPTGKKVSKTSFVWSLIDDYGFKLGKKQDVVDIMRCVPIEYIPTFNEGYKA